MEDLVENEIEFEEDIEIEEEDLSILEDKENRLKFTEKKITSPIMTIYEKVRVISERIKQIDNGHRSTIEEIIKERNITKSYDIAMLEFELKKIPKYYVKRVLPNNTFELWSHEDFDFFPL